MSQLIEVPNLEGVVEELRLKLTQPGISLPEKYRVLFSLRNLKGSSAHQALVQGKQRG